LETKEFDIYHQIYDFLNYESVFWYQVPAISYHRTLPHVSYYPFLDRGIAHLPRTLKHVSLAYCTNITDEGLVHLPRGLEKLNLSGCTKVTDEGLRHIPQYIKHLNLSDNANITTEGLARMPTKMLQYLVVRNCPNVSDECSKVLPHGVLVYM
jgi:hypothetical protein